MEEGDTRRTISESPNKTSTGPKIPEWWGSTPLEAAKGRGQLGAFRKKRLTMLGLLLLHRDDRD